MGIFRIATSCLRHFLQLLLALLDDEASQGPLLGRFSPPAMEMVSARNRESDPLPLTTSHRSNVALYRAPAPPPSKLKPPCVCCEHTPNAKSLPNGLQEPYMPILCDRRAGVVLEQEATHEPPSSFLLCQPPCDLPILLNSDLPPRSCTSMSISSRSSMVSTPVLPSWSPGTPITPTRQPRRKVPAAGGGKLVGLGIQILYDGDRSRRQFDGLGLVPSRMSRMSISDTAGEEEEEEEDLGVPSRILLEEIYNTFTSPEALGAAGAAAAAAPFPVVVEKDLADDETSVEDDVFTARNIAAQGPNASSTPRKKRNRSRSRLSYGLPTAASARRARRLCLAESEEGDESRSSSDSSGGSAQKPAWRY